MLFRRHSPPLAIRGTAAAAILALALAGFSGAATAQANRTFVSAQFGNDSNPCTVASPCRGFQKAESVTNAGGEILALDSGGYGVLTITKSLTVNAPDGIEAGVTTSSAGDAITINAPGGVVNLRGLTLVGGGVGGNGITFTAGAALDIENCIVAGFTNIGLNLVPGASVVTVTDTIVSDNGSDGISFFPTASATASFKRVQSLRNNICFDVETNVSNVNVIAADSIAASNDFAGFYNQGVNFLIVNSTAINSRNGMETFFSPITIAGTTISGNTTGDFSTFNGGQVRTFGNNFLTDNGSVTGTLTPIARE